MRTTLTVFTLKCLFILTIGVINAKSTQASTVSLPHQSPASVTSGPQNPSEDRLARVRKSKRKRGTWNLC